MKKLLCSGMISALLGMTACAHFKPYQIDVPQGIPLTQAQAKQIQTGMSPEDVRSILGSPSLMQYTSDKSSFWTYMFHYTRGTYAKRDKITAENGQLLKIAFENNVVVGVSGIETLPTQEQRFTMDEMSQ